jgi:hypothetical protein
MSDSGLQGSEEMPDRAVMQQTSFPVTTKVLIDTRQATRTPTDESQKACGEAGYSSVSQSLLQSCPADMVFTADRTEA